MSRKVMTSENPRFTNARPLVGEMREVIRRALKIHPGADVEMLQTELYKRFVQDGLVESSDWGEDLVYSMTITEVEAMWAKAEVV